MIQRTQNIAGLGVGSSKKESFYFCLLQYFEEEERWFLKTCQQFKDITYPETEDGLIFFIDEFKVSRLMVDFPLSGSFCDDCKKPCPGSVQCIDESVVSDRQRIGEILEADKAFHDEFPKKYERLRTSFDRDDQNQVLSKPLKRKLKKGIIPYWNRKGDLDTWIDFHDDLLKYFKTSFESFSNGHFLHVKRFNYLKRHFPQNLEIGSLTYHFF